MSNRNHEILRASKAWERLQLGIPREIEPAALRDYLHDLANVLPVVVDELDRALDALDTINDRVDTRHAEHDDLNARVFDGETGIIVRLKAEFEKRSGAIVKGLIATMGTLIGTLIVLLIQSRGSN